MKKNFGQQTWFYPLPVLIIGSYDEAGKANAMNAAWGGIYDRNHVILSLNPGHKTTQNIKVRGAFTVSFADAAHVVEADYVGLVSANGTKDKLERAGFHTTKSEYVDAPIIDELPMTLECKLTVLYEDGKYVDSKIVGEIVNVSADERILDIEGNIDPSKLQAISLDPVNRAYLKLGEYVGDAFRDGAVLKA